MEDLISKEQVISVVPQDFRNSVKGRVVNVDAKSFDLEVGGAPEGILTNHLIEFYSQTANGVLYFTSDVIDVQGKNLRVLNPIKHRFLQRRQFSRITMNQGFKLMDAGSEIDAALTDISAGGMKFVVPESLNLDSEYGFEIELGEENILKGDFQPIRVEKREDGAYTVSGRFPKLNNIDKMSLIQFCIRKKIEGLNK